MSFKCNFCHKEFSSKSSLKFHKDNAKFCIKSRNKNEELKCNLCDKKLSSIQRLESHTNICKQNIQVEYMCIKQENEKYKEQIRQQEHQMKKQEDQMKDIIANYKEHIIKQEEQIKDLVNKLDRLASKAIDRPINNTTVNNKIITLNVFPSQKEIDQKIQSQFNDKYLWNGIKGVAQFVYDHIVKLEDGSMAYACFDTSRQIFKYKDENGNEIKDPKAGKLTKMIKPGLIKQSQVLFEFFNEECDNMEDRKNKGLEIDSKEYSDMNKLKEKAFDVGCDLLSIDETNKFSTELASLSCI